nr:organic cation/carnitine transporter 7-like [Tanacetum cinerariifolium]
PVFLGSTIVTSLAGLISCGAPNYVTLLILGFIVGLGLGGTHVFTTWFMKFVPTLRRGAWMIAFFVSCSIGTRTEALLAWGIVEMYGWRLLLGVSLLPSLVVLLFYTLVPESPRFLYTKDESTHNVQPSINTPSAPPMIVEVSRVNESKEEEDEIKDVTLDIDKTVAGEIQNDEAHHTLKKDDPVDRAGPKVEQGNPENEKEDETNEKTKLIIRHNNTHEFLDITSVVESIIHMDESISQLVQLFSLAWWRTTALPF